MLASSFSSVVLPEPLRPAMPKNSGRDGERDVLERAQLLVVDGAKWVQDALLEGLHAVGRHAVGLVDVADLDCFRVLSHLRCVTPQGELGG